LVKEELVKVLFTTQIAWTLYNKGKKVGVLDVDLGGPSIPRMMNVEGKDIHQCSAGLHRQGPTTGCYVNWFLNKQQR